jgi:hypothetical protein
MVEIQTISQAAQEHGDPSGSVEVLHVPVARGLEIDQQGSFPGDAIEVVEREGHAGPPSDGQQMDHGVGRPPNRSQHVQGIVEGGFGQDVAGQ